MATPRFFADTATGSAVYHCVSRIVGQQRILDDAARDEFVRMMRAYEGFNQVRVLAYVVMPDHFHLLVEVKARPVGRAAAAFSDEWIVKQLRQIYAKPYVDTFEETISQMRSQGQKGGKMAEELREQHLGRMWDVSQFMKEFKQRFSLWFNKRNGRRGTLWEQRFTSVLVEDKAAALSVLSAYLDLNSVRAGLVEHPGDYPWCNYAAAKAGDRKALSALAKVTGLQPVDDGSRLPSAAKMFQLYEPFLAPVEGNAATGSAGKGGRKKAKTKKTGEASASDGEAGEAAPKRKGPQPRPKLSLQEGLRHQVRYFSHGVAVGSDAFIEQVFKSHRDRFQPERKTGARPMKEVDFGELKSMRGLRSGVVKREP